MRLVISREPLRRILDWTQLVLIAGGVSMLSYCGFVVAGAWAFQRSERIQLERISQFPTTSPLPVEGRGLSGRIEIPRLGLSVMVTEGVSDGVLRRAAGHIPGTALPGEPGNVGISAHRDTFFRPLRNIQLADEIILTTVLGEYRYHVVSTRIVNPSEVSVLAPGPSEVLTLVTCYPFYFIGSAPDRFIVRAERVI